MRILRELSRRKLRTSLTITGITIGIWALVVFSSMANQINGLVGMGTKFYADKINEPILLIHGEADNNQGTYPINSERLFAAISGLGGTARLVMLPLE